nr:MAG TPA: hypothetical protein [Caudoviricetes sp.]
MRLSILHRDLLKKHLPIFGELLASQKTTSLPGGGLVMSPYQGRVSCQYVLCVFQSSNFTYETFYSHVFND